MLVVAVFCNVFFCFNFVVSAEEEKPDGEGVGGVEVVVPPTPWNGLTYERFDENGTGSKEDPYIIDTAGKLAYLAQTVNYTSIYSGVYFKQTADIDLGATYNFQTGEITGAMWNSIGYYNSATEYKVFGGNYDGNGYNIYNVGISETVKHNASYGLFGYTNGATITNVNLEININLDTGVNGVGGLVGRANNTIVSHCKVGVNIAGNITNAGGLVGVFNSDSVNSLSNNETNGSITATASGSNVAGIVAQVNNSIGEGTIVISNSIADVAIDAYNQIGGICASVNGKVNFENCTNYSQINAHNCNNVGGIIGFGLYDITNCSNYGNITSNGSDIGGIVGYNTGSIINCTNYATITAQNKVGGIAGTSKNILRDCSNKGAVKGKDYVGGVVGVVENAGTTYTFEKNYNSAIVEGENYVAGLVAKLISVDVQLCFSVGSTANTTEQPYDIVGKNYVAGLVALVDNANIKNCFSTSNVFTESSGAGLIARYNGPAYKNIIENFYYIGSVTGVNIAGIIQDVGFVNAKDGYSVVKLIAIDGETKIDLTKSGAVVGVSNESTYQNVCYNKDICSTPSGTIVSGIVEVNTDQLIYDELEILEAKDFFVLPEEPVQVDYYYDYYPLLRDLHFDIYNPEYYNYFINHIEISPVVKQSAVARTFETVHITFVTNCDVEVGEVICRQNVDITELVPNVSKVGYIFRGWYLDPDFAIRANLEEGLTSSTTLYARFDYPEIGFPWWIFIIILLVAIIALVGVLLFVFRKKTISFRVQGVDIPDIKIRVGTFIKLPKPKMTGHRFKGWYYNEELTKKFDLDIMPNIDLILFGAFKKIERKAKVVEDTKEKKVVKKSKKVSSDTPTLLKETEQKGDVGKSIESDTAINTENSSVDNEDIKKEQK